MNCDIHKGLRLQCRYFINESDGFCKRPNYFLCEGRKSMGRFVVKPKDDKIPIVDKIPTIDLSASADDKLKYLLVNINLFKDQKMVDAICGIDNFHKRAKRLTEDQGRYIDYLVRQALELRG